ncbi:hypothetical protein [Altererythrobacter sp. ZODW24]|uniref:hypothetical protein n=1 Tax=Altererythrobacter sp. ZODW24 TaxID=2185142 RepID=UPI000DF78327|nr:hypothetical protein [Altererythrobacter sp. ZODW24]
MKTAYTDNYGIYPWAMLFVGVLNFWWACEGLAESDGNQLGVHFGAGVLFAILAGKRFYDVRQANLDGRDPTILRNTDK